uniref:Conserved oligomeric Golgi complex subunit 2 n=1 Tax=Capra hircus TaxID=9925 RepID=A0A8C2RW76_CAPHI
AAGENALGQGPPSGHLDHVQAPLCPVCLKGFILTAVNLSNGQNGVSLLFSLLLFLYVGCDVVAIILFFWLYFQEDFDVDHFVSDCRKRVQLEALRDDLELYYKLLKAAMVELINKDYADFVNLSTNLVGMDKALNQLSVPLGQLREEVLVSPQIAVNNLP